MVDGKTKPSRVVGSLSFERPKSPVDLSSGDEGLRLVEGTKCAMPFCIKYSLPKELPCNEETLDGKVSAVAEEVFGVVEQTFSTYEPSSELNRFNECKENMDFAMSPAMQEVIHAAEELVSKTRHLFDPAIGPIFNHYVSTASGSLAKKEPAREGKEPVSHKVALEMKTVTLWKSLIYQGFTTDAVASQGKLSKTLKELQPFSTWSAFEVSECGKFIRKTHPRAKLSLNAISKGWAVDELCRRLLKEGLSQFYVDWAGDIKVHGQHPSGRNWRVSVGEPPSIERVEQEAKKRTSSANWDGRSLVTLWSDGSIGEEKYLAFLDLRDGEAVATSGDFERVVLHNGMLFSHVINPTTALLKRLDDVSLAQAAVVSSSCMVADALATATLSCGDPRKARIMLSEFRTGYKEPVRDCVLYCRGGPRIIRLNIPGRETEQQRQQRLSSHLPAKVIVVGGGLAGLSAAISAADIGAEVILLEKESRTGGNSAKATSGINGWGTETQARASVADEERFFERDTFRSGIGGTCNEALVRLLSTKSSSAIDWLQHRFGIPLTVLAQLGGHSAKRTHRAPPDENDRPVPIGYLIMRTLKEAIDREYSGKITVHTGTRVTELCVDVDASGMKTVTGLKYEREDEAGPGQMSGDSVILCTGGYGFDQSDSGLLLTYRPDLKGVPTTNGPHAVGQGVRMGEHIGAALVDMDKVQLHPTGFIDPKDPTNNTKYLAPEAIRGSGALLLNSTGCRFVNELDLRSVVAKAIQDNCEKYKGTETPFAWCVLNEDGQKLFGLPTLGFYKDRLGLWNECADFKAVAELIGCDEPTLLRTIEAYAEAQTNGVCRATGKLVFPTRVLPTDKNLVVARVTPSIHYTMGGLNINAAAEVQEVIQNNVVGSHRHIRRLFAAGEVTGGLHGSNRLGGNSLLECTVFGRIAGERAAMINNPKDAAFDDTDEWVPCEMREIRLTDAMYGKNTREFRFNLHGSLQRSGLAVGEYVAIRGELDGETLQGYFSPITRPEDEGVIGILCRFDSKGGPIYDLLNYIRAGSVVYLKAIGGLRLNFTPTGIIYEGRQVNKLGLLAGGTGIAPMIQIIREYIHYAEVRKRNGEHVPMHGVNLLYAAEEEHDLAFMEKLHQLQQAYAEHFRFYPILCNPPLGWTAGVGYIKPKNIQEHVFYPPEPDQLFVVCGPPMFEKIMRRMLRSLHFEDKLVYTYSKTVKI